MVAIFLLPRLLRCTSGSLSHFAVLLCLYSGDHTETVQLKFDPQVTSYSDLLEIFWANHSSTTPMSRQYMSAIFYHNEEQRQLALETKEKHQKKEKKPIVTVIKEAARFYDAEE